MTLNRTKISEMRAAIYRTERHNAPVRVFAQIQDGGTWKPVTEIKVIGKIIWVRLDDSPGSYMAHDVKMMGD